MPPSSVDPKGGSHGRNVLVVSAVPEPAVALAPHLHDGDVVKVVVPVVGQGMLDWLANDERAFSHAVEVAEETARELPGRSVMPAAGEGDIVLAIHDALATFPADEIVVALEEGDERVNEAVAADPSSAGRTIQGVPVRIVRLTDPAR